VSRTLVGDYGRSVDSTVDKPVEAVDDAVDSPVDEQELTGGNTTGVVRIGDTVHREAGPWTPTVQRLLAHVRAAGVTEVPAPLGLDDQGREIVSYLPGDVPGWPAPAWLWSERVLAEAGRLLRRFHDATAGFPRSDAVWRLPATEPAEVICHNDAAPYNMVFRDGRLAGLFDLDTASPGPRVRDLAYLAYRIAPFSSDAFAGATYDVAHLDPVARLDRLTEAYGAEFRRAEVLDAMADKLRDLAAWSEARADGDGPPELREHAAMYRADADRIAALVSQPERPDRETNI
jgi:Ser/Thr protein kinase RdoA (MazF antagonist)